MISGEFPMEIQAYAMHDFAQFPKLTLVFPPAILKTGQE